MSNMFVGVMRLHFHQPNQSALHRPRTKLEAVTWMPTSSLLLFGGTFFLSRKKRKEKQFTMWKSILPQLNPLDSWVKTEKSSIIQPKNSNHREKVFFITFPSAMIAAFPIAGSGWGGERPRSIFSSETFIVLRWGWVTRRFHRTKKHKKEG